MADTVITPAAQDSGNGAAGWAVAVIILLAVVLVGIFVWPGLSRAPAGSGDASTPDAIDVNVRLPQVPVGDAPSGASGSGNVQAPAPAQ